MALRCVCVSVSLCLRVSVSLCLCVVLLFVNICTQIGIFHMGTGPGACDKISKNEQPDWQSSFGDWIRNLW